MHIIAHITEDETTYAKVYEVHHACLTDADAVAEIKRQLLEWGVTGAGYEANKECNSDFNWGDLSSWLNVIVWQYPILGVDEVYSGSGIGVNHDELLLEG